MVEFIDFMTPLRFLQTEFWASFKGAHGWTPYYFRVKEGKIELISSQEDVPPSELSADNLLTVLVREFSLKVKRFSIAYIPMAPEYPDDRNVDSLQKDFLSSLESTAILLKPFLPKNTICIRFDPAVDFNSCEERDEWNQKASFICKKLSIKKAPVAIQPPDTTILSLNKNEDEILASMKSKWRYNIRLASKKGVAVTKHFAQDADFNNAFEEFYALFEQTSRRDGVSFHQKSYYLDLLKRGAPDSEKSSSENKRKPLITLYLAKHEGEPLAGIITLFCGREAVYLYGASGNIKRNLMPAYLLQWTAIQDAKKYGCPVYDFYGMPPTDDEKHPMHGLYLFKTGFGGAIVHRPGSYDAQLSWVYNLYIAAERFRAWWHKKAIKKIHGR